jgi:putative radical SAM enzyme (TIGR03279 family)
LIEIAGVSPQGRAALRGVRKGDRVVSINGTEVHDGIDYHYLASDERVTLVLLAAGGKKRTLRFEKDPDDLLGIEVEPFRVTRCRNRCIFCFVDQMPRGVRNSLRVKDDDFRASFLYGNYITLGSLSEADWQRIFSQRLSPLYISVHATEPGLRQFILRNRNTPDIMLQLKRLAEGGIRMHTQIVLAPGINDGAHLDRTLADLASLVPSVSSIAVVPVGLTSFRAGCYPLRLFTRREARATVEKVEAFGNRFKRSHGVRLAFASDEFFRLAGLSIHRFAYYEDFPQLENGVGMIADFLKRASAVRIPARVPPLSAYVVSGASFSPLLRAELARFRKIAGLSISLITARNAFFGPSVTVAGLLTGGDILDALKSKRKRDWVFIPANVLKDDERIFLDGMTLEELGHRLKMRIVPVEGISDMIAFMQKGKERA